MWLKEVAGRWRAPLYRQRSGELATGFREAHFIRNLIADLLA
jgi:hypothetical protein